MAMFYSDNNLENNISQEHNSVGACLFLVLLTRSCKENAINGYGLLSIMLSQLPDRCISLQMFSSYLCLLSMCSSEVVPIFSSFL